jgi:hypothetical protein
VSAVSSGLKVARGAGDRKGRLLALEVGPRKLPAAFAGAGFNGGRLALFA